MMRAKRSLMASALAAAMILAASMPTASLAQDSIAVNKRPGEMAMMFDVLAARPLLFVSTVVGTGLFIVSLPFSALGGNTGEAAEVLVKVPARSTFLRCLGCTPAQHDRLMAEKAVERANEEQEETAE